MKFSLFREHGAQNSKPAFDVFADSPAMVIPWSR